MSACCFKERFVVGCLFFSASGTPVQVWKLHLYLTSLSCPSSFHPRYFSLVKMCHFLILFSFLESTCISVFLLPAPQWLFLEEASLVQTHFGKSQD